MRMQGVEKLNFHSMNIESIVWFAKCGDLITPRNEGQENLVNGLRMGLTGVVIMRLVRFMCILTKSARPSKYYC